MKPEKVNPNNFKVDKVIYDDEEFSIALGKWADNTKVIGMRWNGDEDESLGYPNAFGKPMWFVVPTPLAKEFIKTLLGNEHSKMDLLVDTISMLNE